MNAVTSETLSPEAIETTRAEVRRIIAEEGIAQTEIARQADIAYGTFTPWMTNKYAGDSAKIAVKVTRWLETRRERARTLAVLPAAPGFVMTSTAASFMETLAFSQATPDFGVIVGGAGVGKTTTIEEYQRRASNVTIVTGEPCHSSPNNMLTAIATEMGIAERRSNMISGAIVARLRGASALLVIDEAQHLDSKALDQLRTIHDKAKCGVVVAGNESVFARLQGDARTAQFAQLYSRVGARTVQSQSRPKDICALILAWGIDGESDEGKLLKVIARKPGALRGMTKAIRYASMIANGAGEPLACRHIKQAWAQLSSLPLDDAA
ncbi:AAA family ATPase [Xanthobacter sp. KR7-225]|uniref:AAA family ATPase n=1 Tax=Xanthobacter sp. KR7-225 TaxID=3156613 RepID=UPI0032B34F7F